MGKLDCGLFFLRVNGLTEKMDDSLIELLILFLLILGNGLFSMSEIALISSRRARLEQQAADGNENARIALELSNHPGKFLSTIQVGITLVGVLTGAFGGATLAEPLSVFFNTIPAIAPYSEELSFGVVVIAISYLTLIVGELVPKQIGLRNPEAIAIRVASPMSVLLKITSPVVNLLNGSANLVLHLIGIKNSNEPDVTEDEIKMLIKQGTQLGVFEAVEHDMVLRIFRLSDRRVSAIMTPRTDIEWIDLEDSEDEIRNQLMQKTHSRFVVAHGDLDNVDGIIRVKDVAMTGFSTPIANLKVLLKSRLRKPLYVPETLPVFNLMENFKKKREQMALIIDEHGSVQGIVTLNDILESIVGDLPFEDEPEEQSILEREDGSWLIDGMLPIDEFWEFFNIKSSQEEEWGYQTLGGFVMTKLGRIPVTSDTFDAHQMRFEVVDMDGKRVDKVLVSRLPNGESSS
ncbi:protein of unknown function DUF21 [Chloroherpeton thalassium ATCC 35110]|uniref:CBS domain containing protein n=1 Tax=Chloroherpeton thalassium (strain ATCC 35110 / GB-78) TaxID=517418 RepID=B3QS78_CHLT3|nr:hemolysin family protein [Chloroherpeton thalassium]ACF14023.1 protein of unknown function DUF21 [Chloroherpeton thalassium ATCC 35110]